MIELTVFRIPIFRPTTPFWLVSHSQVLGRMYSFFMFINYQRVTFTTVL